jgi:hypothetical protein
MTRNARTNPVATIGHCNWLHRPGLPNPLPPAVDEGSVEHETYGYGGRSKFKHQHIRDASPLIAVISGVLGCPLLDQETPGAGR